MPLTLILSRFQCGDAHAPNEESLSNKGELQKSDSEKDENLWSKKVVDIS